MADGALERVMAVWDALLHLPQVQESLSRAMECSCDYKPADDPGQPPLAHGCPFHGHPDAPVHVTLGAIRSALEGHADDALAALLAASAPVPDAGGGEVPVYCATGDYEIARQWTEHPVHGAVPVCSGCAQQALADGWYVSPPAAPPVPDDAPMPEDVRREACRAAANALARDFATPTGLDSEQVARAVSAAGAVIYRAGLAARRPAGPRSLVLDEIDRMEPSPELRASVDAVRARRPAGVEAGDETRRRLSAALAGLWCPEAAKRGGQVIDGEHCAICRMILAAEAVLTSPPRPVGVDRKSLRRAIEQALREEEALRNGRWLRVSESDLATDLVAAAAVAPLLGVTGGGK